MKSNNKVAIYCVLLFSIASFNFILCEEDGLILQAEVIEGQTDQPNTSSSDESFIAIHKDAVGTKEDLNPEMRALMAMTIKFLPLDYRFVRIISATREVVAGIKYSILANAVVNQTEEEICLLEILEKPWVVTDFGEKLRTLQYSNCTGEGVMEETNTEVNPIFKPKQGQEMTEERLTNVDDQIISQAKEDELKLQKNKEVNAEVSPQNDLKAKIQEALQELFNSDENVQQAIAAIVASSNSKEVQERYENVLEQLVQSVVKNIFNNTSNINESFSYEIPIRLEKPTGPVDGAVIYVEKDSQVSNSRRKRSILLVEKETIVGGKSSVKDEKTLKEVRAYTDQAFDRVVQGEAQECKLSDVEDITQQVVAGIKYSGQVKYTCGNEDKICELEIWTQSWSGLLKFFWNCEHLKKYSSNYRKKRGIFGGHHDLNANEMTELEEMVIDALHTASEKNENRNYHFVEIKSATKQVVSGYAYHAEVDAKDDNDQHVHCTVRIHVQRWKNSNRDVKITCDEETFKFHQNDHHHEQHHSHLAKGEEHIQQLFEKFKIRHKRRYASLEEHQRRYNIFKQNLVKMEELNRNEEGTARYGITEFADMNTQEFKKYTGLIPREHSENEVRNPMADILDIELPKSFDWREKNVVSEVKNQGSCGSCWAFSVVGNIEGQHAIKYGNLEEYSEQELVDCDKTDNGCGGGYMDDAYKAIEKLGGLELESDYGYEARNDACRFNSSKVHVRVKGGVDLPKNETAIAQFLVQNGPISIGLNANAMQFYRGGVSKPIKFLCNPKGLDHGVLAVGYGVAEYPKFKKTLPYWIIKNSWGPHWGEQGYYRLYRGDNRCGVANMASSAVIE